jgi:hypothetical protein
VAWVVPAGLVGVGVAVAGLQLVRLVFLTVSPDLAVALGVVLVTAGFLAGRTHRGRAVLSRYGLRAVFLLLVTFGAALAAGFVAFIVTQLVRGGKPL